MLHANHEKTESIWGCLKENLGKRLTSLLLMSVITVSSVVTAIAATKDIEIEFNGQNYSIQSTSGETDDILKQAQAQHPEIKVTGGDKITRDDGEEIRITVETQYNPVVRTESGNFTATVYYGDTVADALRNVKLSLTEYDTVEPGLAAEVEDISEIVVTRNVKVSVTADGSTNEVLVPYGSTVQDALVSQEITMGAQDRLNVSSTAKVENGSEIVLNRVVVQEVTVEEEIPFETVVKKDANLTKGKTKIETVGTKGKQSALKRQTLVDGEVEKEETVSASVLQTPVNEVKIEGTKPVGGSSATISGGALYDQQGNRVNYSRVISGKCTAYTGGGTTSTGVPAAVGRVAVNPNVIPYGTKLYICSPDGGTVYGYAIAADTGGAMMDGRVLADLYHNSYSECMNFGVRNMNLYVLG